MGRKWNLSEDGGREDKEEKLMKEKRVKEKQERRESMWPSMIKNKEKRAVVHAKLSSRRKLKLVKFLRKKRLSWGRR
ncbi:hypothetical protein RDI58_027240 [Solanum bulbocastanum]|uniref:Uncharacterized protein n=1 Tax=Solanum bulbocastanum TaxID=147425 RepID=A0AAN8SYG4_SOLBU